MIRGNSQGDSILALCIYRNHSSGIYYLYWCAIVVGTRKYGRDDQGNEVFDLCNHWSCSHTFCLFSHKFYYQYSPLKI